MVDVCPFTPFLHPPPSLHHLLPHPHHLQPCPSSWKRAPPLYWGMWAQPMMPQVRIQLQCPSSSKGMWAGFYSFDGGNWGDRWRNGGRKKMRGDPGIGKPIQCIMEQTTMESRGSFSFILHSILPHWSPLTPTPSDDDGNSNHNNKEDDSTLCNNDDNDNRATAVAASTTTTTPAATTTTMTPVAAIAQ